MMGIGKFACVFFILIFSISLTQSAFAQSSCPPDYVMVNDECVYAFDEEPQTSSLTIETDQLSYDDGDIILISGEVKDLFSGVPVALQIISPIGNAVIIIQLDVDTDKTFNTEVIAGGAEWDSQGTYTIIATYGAGVNPGTAETTFFYTPSIPTCPPDYVTVFNECVYAFAEPPNPPSGLVAVAISPTRVDLSWNAPTDDGGSLIIGYRIDVKIGSGSYVTLVQNTNSLVRAYSHLGLTSDTTYYYGVFAINSVGMSTSSNVAFVRPTSDGGTIPLDTVPPKILTPSDIVVDATHSNGGVARFEVLAIDDVDEIITSHCIPLSGSFFLIGDTLVTCSAFDSAGNAAPQKSFLVTVRPISLLIPDWIKEVAVFWCDDKIDDASFIEGIQYLIDNNILIVSASSSEISGSQNVPSWVKNIACWWSHNQIGDQDFASSIQYLIEHGIVRV